MSATATKTRKPRTRVCAYCSDRLPASEVYKTPHDDWLCSTCFGDHWEWCEICKEHKLREGGTCRHIFWTENGYMGVGSNEIDWKYHKEGVFAVLDKTDLAHEIRSALQGNGIKTLYWGPMLGTPNYDFECGGLNLGHRFTDDLTYEEEMAMTPGVGWLDSIADEEVRKLKPDAIALTISWIDEWERIRGHHQAVSFFHGSHPYQQVAETQRTVLATARRILRGSQMPAQAWLSNCGRYVGWYEKGEGMVNPVVTDGNATWRWGSANHHHMGSWGNRGDRRFEVSLITGSERIGNVCFDREINQLADEEVF